ncbi:MAG: endonuclease domain-containing protein [Bacteroidales bacterium]|nr:endonuclease domain-containing protein [Bacteroidales bacterium]
MRRPQTHSSVSRTDSSPNLGEQPEILPASDNASDRDSSSSPKLGEVARRAGGVCSKPTPAGGVCKTPVAAKPRTHNLSILKNSRRELRSHGTPAEGRLWRYLKNGQVDGLHFRRQFSVGKSILDFYCPELCLAIELDGDYHRHVTDRDYSRDQEMLSVGITTLRFENHIVFEQPDTIIESIRQFRRGVLTHSSVSRASVDSTRSSTFGSPNLGEQPEIQPAPANSSPMRVVSSGDHEGDEAKSPRSRQLLSSEPSSCYPRRAGGVCQPQQ